MGGRALLQVLEGEGEKGNSAKKINAPSAAAAKINASSAFAAQLLEWWRNWGEKERTDAKLPLPFPPKAVFNWAKWPKRGREKKKLFCLTLSLSLLDFYRSREGDDDRGRKGLKYSVPKRPPLPPPSSSSSNRT